MKLELQPEFRFHYVRKWAFDYALPDYKIAIEIDGGTRQQGRHNRAEGYAKDAEKIIAPYRWIAMMKAELEAGSEIVIAEAREAGNVGIFRSTGEVRSGLVEEILTQIPSAKILWEAPNKAQQTWFIKMQGCNVNLGNIAPHEVVALETLRLGLRSDTFAQFLDS